MATILEIAALDKNLSIMMKALKAAGVDSSLTGIGPFTILAPINLVFGKMKSPDTYDQLMGQIGKTTRMADVMNCHILKGKKLLRDFRDGQKIPNIFGTELLVSVKDDEVRVNGARILTKDRQGSNGVVHSIDAVQIPA